MLQQVVPNIANHVIEASIILVRLTTLLNYGHNCNILYPNDLLTATAIISEMPESIANQSYITNDLAYYVQVG